jgi:hypothetical protein
MTGLYGPEAQVKLAQLVINEGLMEKALPAALPT